MTLKIIHETVRMQKANQDIARKHHLAFFLVLRWASDLEIALYVQ